MMTLRYCCQKLHTSGQSSLGMQAVSELAKKEVVHGMRNIENGDVCDVL
jgi:hypothetical protein